MPVEESRTGATSTKESTGGRVPVGKGGFESRTGIYHSLVQLGDNFLIPTSRDLGTAKYVLSQFPHPDEAESRIALVDSRTEHRVTYSQLRRSINALASSLHHGLGIQKGDVVFLLSPNSTLYPAICLAIFSIGAILSPANPINTQSEIVKQVRDSGAKLIISAPEERYKLAHIDLPILLTTCKSDDGSLSVEEFIEDGDPLEVPQVHVTQSDTAAILYSSGTTGTSKGVILTHANFIVILTLLKWTVHKSSSQDDIYLCFIPMFHVYGLAFFALGLFTVGVKSVIMQKFDMQAMLNAIEVHQVSNIPAVPPVIVGLIKNASKGKCDLSSLRRIGTGAAPLSKEVSDEFRQRFPWVELRPGYGLTESCGATTYFVHSEQAKTHPFSCGMLLPTFTAKIVDIESGLALSPNQQGELWIKSSSIMKGYLGNHEATAAMLDSDGWLKTGDLGYFDEDGCLHIVERIKELIKHKGYQVAPAELEDILLGHPQILDAAVIPVEDEESGQIPMGYVVRAAGSELTEEQVIQFVAKQVAPYKKVRRVSFISAIPKSGAGKILRKQLVSQTQQQRLSKL